MKKNLRNAFQKLFSRSEILKLRGENEKLKELINTDTKRLCQAGEELQKLKLSIALDSFEKSLKENTKSMPKEQINDMLNYAQTPEKFSELSAKVAQTLEKCRRNSLLNEIETKAKPTPMPTFNPLYAPDRELLHKWAQEIMQTHRCSYEEALHIIDKSND